MTPSVVRRAAWGLAATRALLGVVALVIPERAGRVWVGVGATAAGRAVLLRALGGRDVALAAGALVAAVKERGAQDAGAAVQALALWVGMGAVSDLVDTWATATRFAALPKRTRWLTLMASGGAAAAGAAVAATLVWGTDR